ncbi:hypothetical protein GCM10025778_33630 [Paeniglutamicibacter antarcticus]|uniref:Uncharacterized protein n=1 Tax=Paeniglutamicibacter antarcticus TaxID=494023 RepID=A0ABP9TQ12_9MICC
MKPVGLANCHKLSVCARQETITKSLVSEKPEVASKEARAKYTEFREIFKVSGDVLFLAPGCSKPFQPAQRTPLTSDPSPIATQHEITN